MNKVVLILLHIVSVLVFLSVPLLVNPNVLQDGDLLKHANTASDFLATVLAVIFFYGSFYYFVPRFYIPRKYFLFTIFCLVALFIIVWLPVQFFDLSHALDAAGMQDPHKGPWLPSLMNNGLKFFAVLLLSIAVHINSRLRKSEKEKLNAQLSYLKAQINPHFLFNTLNSIYSLAIQKSEKTATSVVMLSGMMRYLTTESERKSVPLDKELEYIRNYIALQQIRLGDTVHVDFLCPEEPHEFEITPLVLITFVENAFKYGVNPEEYSRIVIRIEVKYDKLLMMIKNRKVRLDPFLAAESSGMGIKNAEQRLELAYPGKHDLIVLDSKTEYQVNLKITIA
jgi:Histidine kinase